MATPMPASAIEKQADGTFVVTTEKGEKLIVPQIAGLRQEMEEVNGVKTVIYKAQEVNPYGLTKDKEVGFFFPNVSLDNKDGKVVQTGAVSFHPEVVKKILQQEMLKRDFVFPLPFQIPISAIKEGVYLKEVKDQMFDLGLILFDVPSGTELIFPLLFSDSTPLSISSGGESHSAFDLRDQPVNIKGTLYNFSITVPPISQSGPIGRIFYGEKYPHGTISGKWTIPKFLKDRLTGEEGKMWTGLFNLWSIDQQRGYSLSLDHILTTGGTPVMIQSLLEFIY
jgi:hypothetical protein